MDELGDLDNAIAKAAELAGLDKFDSRVIEQELTPEQLFIQEMFASVSAYLPPSVKQSSVLEKLLTQWSKVLEEFAAFDDPNGVYLYCDNCSY